MTWTMPRPMVESDGAVRLAAGLLTVPPETKKTQSGSGRRITRGLFSARARASCRDSTGHGTDGTHRAGINWRVVP